MRKMVVGAGRDVSGGMSVEEQSDRLGMAEWSMLLVGAVAWFGAMAWIAGRLEPWAGSYWWAFVVAWAGMGSAAALVRVIFATAPSLTRAVDTFGRTHEGLLQVLMTLFALLAVVVALMQ